MLGLPKGLAVGVKPGRNFKNLGALEEQMLLPTGTAEKCLGDGG